MNLGNYTVISVAKLELLKAQIKKYKAQAEAERINTITLTQTIKTLRELLDIEQQNTRMKK